LLYKPQANFGIDLNCEPLSPSEEKAPHGIPFSEGGHVMLLLLLLLNASAAGTTLAV
jgi:hypothetical protein